MKSFSETVTYVCCYVLRLRDRTGGREVAWVIKAEVEQGVESKEGSALNLRNLFFFSKKLSFLLCNVATLRRHDVGSLTFWNLMTLDPNIAMLTI